MKENNSIIAERPSKELHSAILVDIPAGKFDSEEKNERFAERIKNLFIVTPDDSCPDAKFMAKALTICEKDVHRDLSVFHNLLELLARTYPVNDPKWCFVRNIIEEIYLKGTVNPEYNLAFKKQGPSVYDNLRQMMVKNRSIVDILNDEESELKFISRINSEYNPNYLQLSVGCLILDKEEKNAAVLECVSGEFKGKLTLVQGHTSYNYLYSYMEDPRCRDYYYINRYLSREMLKELNEEVKVVDDNKQFTIGNLTSRPGSDIPILIPPSGEINIHNPSYYHFGAVYRYHVENDEDFKTLFSGEDDKHVVKIVPITRLIDAARNYSQELDDWLLYTLKSF